MSQQWRTTKPGADEHAPAYGQYISEAPTGDLVKTLESQRGEVKKLLDGIPEAKGGHRYAAGKWSIKAVIGHLSDSERVFVYRLMRFARGDATELPRFDENAMAAGSNADARSLADLSEEFDAVRHASLTLLRTMPDDLMQRRGTASGKQISNRALAWILAGHVTHHLTVLREKHLS